MNMVTHDLTALLAGRNALAQSLGPPFHAYRITPPQGRSFYALGRSITDAMRLVEQSIFAFSLGLQEEVTITRVSR